MDFGFSEREELLRKSVRELAEGEITEEMIETMEETGKFPMEVIQPLAKMGVTGVITPQEYGGVGLGYMARMIALEEIGRVSAAVSMGLQVHHMACAAIQDFGSDELKEKYLPPLARGETMGVVAVTEPSGGSDVMGMQSRAELKGDTEKILHEWRQGERDLNKFLASQLIVDYESLDRVNVRIEVFLTRRQILQRIQ